MPAFVTPVESGIQGVPLPGTMAVKTGMKALIFRAARNKVLEKRHGEAYAEAYR